MPIYVYKFVDTGETIEVEQAFTDDTLTKYPHPDSGKPMAVKKVFQPVGVTFKGSGFYKTDSRSSTGTKKATSNGSATESGGSSAKSESGTGGSTAANSGSSATTTTPKSDT